MESILGNLKLIISNAKKSQNRPYSGDTIEDKRKEIAELEQKVESLATTTKGVETSEFNKLKAEALEILSLHITNRLALESRQETRQYTTMASLDLSTLSAISKLVPLYTGKRGELDNFIANLEIVYESIEVAKRESFLKFVFRSRLDTKVQTMVKQGTIPTSVGQLIQSLRNVYKPVGNSNMISHQITGLVQKNEPIREFAQKIQELISELNEAQIVEIGEADRASIVRTNNILAFNTFKSGIKDMQIRATINASRVKTFAEALSIAEDSEVELKYTSIMYQNSRGNDSNRGQCKKCGRSHGSICPAKGKECHKCKKMNHFANMCLSRSNEGNGRDNNNDRRNNNNYNNNGRNNRNYNNRNRDVHQIEDQGNSQSPETIHQGSPEEVE